MKIDLKQLALLLLIITFYFCIKSDFGQTSSLITNISPFNGPNTTIVTIGGTHFGNTNNTQVFFNNVEAVIQSVTAT